MLAQRKGERPSKNLEKKTRISITWLDLQVARASSIHYDWFCRLQDNIWNTSLYLVSILVFGDTFRASKKNA
jgi:hypothetical protein